jgi:hypothetical protein
MLMMLRFVYYVSLLLKMLTGFLSLHKTGFYRTIMLTKLGPGQRWWLSAC